MKVLISERLSENKYRTPEGYLICKDAILARTGPQTYRRSEVFGVDCVDSDSEVSIDRKPEQVFADATLASFENKPVTVEHPNVDVNSENYKDYAVGFVRDVKQGKTTNGEDVILGTLVITDADTVDEILNGEHTELSCGYDCDISDSENPEQTNIRGNHVALCEHGRAGIAKIVDSKINDDTKIDYIKNLVNKYSKSLSISVKQVNDLVDVIDWYDINLLFDTLTLYQEYKKKSNNLRRYGITTFYQYVVDEVDKNNNVSNNVKKLLHLYDDPFIFTLIQKGKLTTNVVEELRRNLSCYGYERHQIYDSNVNDDEHRLPQSIKNDIKKYISMASTTYNRDMDIMDIIKPLEHHGYNMIRQNIRGWYKTGDGMQRKDYFYKVDGYSNTLMISLYADPDTWEVHEINGYFTDSINDSKTKDSYVMFEKYGDNYDVDSVKYEAERLGLKLETVNEAGYRTGGSYYKVSGSKNLLRKYLENINFETDWPDDEIYDSIKDATTTRRRFSNYDIGDEPDVDWGTPKGNAYVYFKNGNVIFDGHDESYNGEYIYKEFNSIRDLNRWLNSSVDDSINDVNNNLKKNRRFRMAKYNDSKKIDVNSLKRDLENALKKYYHNDKEMLDYTGVSIKEDNKCVIANVWAEVGYNSLMKIASVIDKVIQKYDKDAYFDAETSGRLISYIWKDSTYDSIQDDDFHKSVPITQEVIDFAKSAFQKYWTIKEQGKTWSGRIHFQIVSKVAVNKHDVEILAKDLDKLNDTLEQKYGTSITYNIGYNPGSKAEAGVTIDNTMRTNDSIKDEITLYKEDINECLKKINKADVKKFAELEQTYEKFGNYIDTHGFDKLIQSKKSDYQQLSNMRSKLLEKYTDNGISSAYGDILQSVFLGEVNKILGKPLGYKIKDSINDDNIDYNSIWFDLKFMHSFPDMQSVLPNYIKIIENNKTNYTSEYTVKNMQTGKSISSNEMDWGKTYQEQVMGAVYKLTGGIGPIRQFLTTLHDSVKDALSQSDIDIIEDSIYWLKKSNTPITSENVLKQLNKDMPGFIGNNKSNIIKYINSKYIKDGGNMLTIDSEISSVKLNKKKNDYDEYTVKVYKNGKYNEDASYYTDDWDDAVGTLKQMAKQYNLNVKQSGSTFVADSKIKDSFVDVNFGPYFDEDSGTSSADVMRDASKRGIRCRHYKSGGYMHMTLQGDKNKIKEFLNDYGLEDEISKIKDSVDNKICSIITAIKLMKKTKDSKVKDAAYGPNYVDVNNISDVSLTKLVTSVKSNLAGYYDKLISIKVLSVVKNINDGQVVLDLALETYNSRYNKKEVSSMTIYFRLNYYTIMKSGEDIKSIKTMKFIDEMYKKLAIYKGKEIYRDKSKTYDSKVKDSQASEIVKELKSRFPGIKLETLMNGGTGIISVSDFGNNNIKSVYSFCKNVIEKKYDVSIHGNDRDYITIMMFNSNVKDSKVKDSDKLKQMAYEFAQMANYFDRANSSNSRELLQKDDNVKAMEFYKLGLKIKNQLQLEVKNIKPTYDKKTAYYDNDTIKLLSDGISRLSFIGHDNRSISNNLVMKCSDLSRQLYSLLDEYKKKLLTHNV